MENVRIPLMVIDHAWVAKEHTFDDLLRVITWSLRQAALGIHPRVREDAREWHKNYDVRRARASGKEIGCKALLCQVVGDWKMYKEIFRFPQHNERGGSVLGAVARPTPCEK